MNHGRVKVQTGVLGRRLRTGALRIGIASLSALAVQACSTYDPRNDAAAGEGGSLTGVAPQGIASSAALPSTTGSATRRTDSHTSGDGTTSLTTSLDPGSTTSGQGRTSDETDRSSGAGVSSSTSVSSSVSTSVSTGSATGLGTSSASSSTTTSGESSSSQGQNVGPCPISLLRDEVLRAEVVKRIPEDESDFASLERLSSLPHEIPGKIRSLSGIECAKNLSSIGLENQDIKDLEPLRQLSKLKEISLKNNPASVRELVDTLGHRLDQIEELTLSVQESESDTKWLDQLTRLRSVSLLGPGISDTVLEPLMLKKALESLSLESVGSFDDRLLLDFCSAESKKKHPGSRCAKLKKMVFQGARLRDLQWLPDSSRLLWLDVRSNLIEDLSPIVRARNLTHALISRNSIRSIKAVSKLQALEFIQLNDNSKLEDLSPLADLTKLRYIQAQNCAISDLSSIAENQSLRELRLQGNSIVSVEPLSKILQLDTVELARNKITSIESLKSLKKLRRLQVDDNTELTSLDAIEQMSILQVIHAQRCKIVDVGPVVRLVRSASLRKVVLNGNPPELCEHESMKELLALRQDPTIGPDLIVLSDCE